MRFDPPLLLQNTHVQTLWAYLAQAAPKVPYRRESLATPDGDEVELDWTLGDSSSPVVLVCHGLEGSSDSPYMRRLMSRIADRGWTGAVLHSRTCAGKDNKQLVSYHSAFIDDLEHVVPMIAARVAPRPVFLVGYSLGGSLVANYLGRRASLMAENVRGAFVCSAPLNLTPGADALQDGFNRVYQFGFLRSLRKKVKIKGRKHQAWRAAAEAAMGARTLRQFDESWTAPVHGFQDADHYYQEASAAPHLHSIRVPMRVLHADDDPFIVGACVPEVELGAAPAVTYTPTGQGGHVGFVSGDSPYWLEDEILDWLGLRVQPIV